MDDQPCTTLDPSGDLRLRTDTQDFIVSSKAMCLASPVWRAMLDPQGPWAKQASGTYSLPEDDQNALLIILRIAHLHFNELPDVLVVYEHLLQLAVLCDKYDTVQLVRPWISKWQAPLQAQAEESGRDGYLGYETWLFIAWTFGDKAVFKKISRTLVLTSTFTTVDDEPRLINAMGDLVGDTVPPGSIEAIIEARSERISDLLKMCYELVDQYQSTTSAGPGETTTICKQDISCLECDSLVYGCLIKGLQSLELFPERVTVSKIESSVNAFAAKLRSLKCYVYPDNYHRQRSKHYYDDDDDEISYSSQTSHSRCSFTFAFSEQISSLVDRKEPSGFLEAHLAHMKEQSGNRL